MFLSSSRLCLEVTEKTRTKACPREMESRCMAGNCCVPVVSVMCIVQIELFDEITFWRTKIRLKDLKIRIHKKILILLPYQIWIFSKWIWTWIELFNESLF